MKSIIFLLIALIYCAEKSDVYFTKTITPERMVDMLKILNVELKGKIGLKVHSGEPNGPYFLRPDFLQKIYDYTQGTFLECNVAYTSDRLTTEKHKQTLQTNGWYDNNRRIEIMDEDSSQDISFNVEPHNKISVTYAGKNLEKYDSCVVLSHFKGHGMGGYGGALKQLSIGFASTQGKTWIHTAGASLDYKDLFPKRASNEDFTASMADAASAIVKYFKSKGDIVYINVMVNISLSCDCAGTSAPAPKIRDMGILASTDPVALDMACLDLIKATSEEGTQEFLDQVTNLDGENTIYKAEALGIGTTKYNLIDVDEDGEDESEGESEGESKGESEGESEGGESEGESEGGESEGESDTTEPDTTDPDTTDPDTTSGNPGSFIGWNIDLILIVLFLFIK